MENIQTASDDLLYVRSKPLPTDGLTMKEMILGLAKMADLRLTIHDIDLFKKGSTYRVSSKYSVENYDTLEQAVESFSMCLDLLERR